MTPAEGCFGDAYEGGSGSALLLLHGLGGTWHIWKPVLHLLEARHRVVALTLPGHHGGCALTPGVEPTVSALTDALLAQLRARGIESAHVAGNSLGGWLGLELARRGFAKSVVALSPAGGWTTADDYRRVARPFRILFALTPLVLMLTTLFLGMAWLRRALGRNSMEHANRIAPSDFRAMLRSMAATRILPRLLETMGRDGPIAPLGLNTPIRIAWAEYDRVIPFETYGRPVLQRVGVAEHQTLRGVGHVPMYDDPQAVAATILEMTVPVAPRRTEVAA